MCRNMETWGQYSPIVYATKMRNTAMAEVGLLIYCSRSEPIPRQTGPVWLEIYCHGFEAPVYSQRPGQCTAGCCIVLQTVKQSKTEQINAIDLTAFCTIVQNMAVCFGSNHTA